MGKNDVRDIFEPLRRKFNEFDRSNNGIITKAEFLQAIKDAGVDANIDETAKFDNLFESFDVAKTGAISVSEFITTLGAPLIRSPKSSVGDVFKETAKILLKQLSDNALEKQWTDICGRHGVDPNRGTLTYDGFKKLLEKECDWRLSDMQIIPIFHYLDLNQNGKISMITIRFMVTEMAKLRGKGRTIMVIDLLKQAVSAAQAEMIMKQAESIVNLNKRLAKTRSNIALLQGEVVLTEMEKEISKADVHVVRPSLLGEAQYHKHLSGTKPSKTIWNRFCTWPLLAMLVWLGTFILFIISMFTARPLGEIWVDLDGFIVSGAIVSIFAALHAVVVWPFRKIDCYFSRWKLVMALVFSILGAIYFILGMTFFNSFWYEDKHCFACRQCTDTTDSICWGDWKLLGDWQDTCPCALRDESYWEDANFDIYDFSSDCNTTLYASNVINYNGDNSVLETCMFYEGGLFMDLGPAMIAFTLVAMLNGCWGFLKNLKEWSRMKEQNWRVNNCKTDELAKKDFVKHTINYGSTVKVEL